MVYALLEGLLNFSHLTATQQKKITDTVTTCLNIGTLGGSSSLTETNQMVIVTIKCPPQIPPSNVVTLFKNSKADLIANINSLFPIPNLTALRDAQIQTQPGRLDILPSGPRVCFQLNGVLSLENFPEDVQNNIQKQQLMLLAYLKVVLDLHTLTVVYL